MSDRETWLRQEDLMEARKNVFEYIENNIDDWNQDDISLFFEMMKHRRQIKALFEMIRTV